MMKYILCSLLLVALSASSATAARQLEQPAGSIKGRITVDGKAQPGVLVSLFRGEEFYYERRSLANVITDADGSYRFTGLAAGRYSVSTYAPVYVNTEMDHNGMNGRLVTVDAGEAVEAINFALVRGGVITGRVTDTEERPVISEGVVLLKVIDGNNTQGFRTPDMQMMMTDDRGIYRIYGVPPGSYLVKVGYPPNMNRTSPGGRYSSYIQTFHPDVTDHLKATTVEVTPGGVTVGIDIKVGRIKKTFVATGRMVDAETGRPVPHIIYGVRLGEGTTPIPGRYRTNEKGEFQIEIAAPSRVTIYATGDSESNTAAQPFSFDLTTERVTGLEIKLRRAQTVSGNIVVQGLNGPDVASKLASLRIIMRCHRHGDGSQNHLSAKVREDGSFTVGGIAASKAVIYLSSPISEMPKPWLVRVERSGAEQGEWFEIAEGESISDLRLVVAYGSGIVRGQVKIEGRSLEEANLFTDLNLSLGFRHTSATRVGAGAQLDARGRFVVEGLLDGEYEVTLLMSRTLPNERGGSDIMSRIQAFKQTVTVTNGAELTVTLPLDLSEKK
jgi:hypothetical protein